MMNTILRPPVVNDYAVIASWIPDAASCLRWAGPRVPFPFTAAQLPALLAVPGGGEASYCLVDSADLLCGFAQSWVLQPGAVHLGRIIVAPDVRGQGVGRIFCQQLIAAALQSTMATKATMATMATAVTLRAYRSNLAAVHLYLSLGFVEVAAESDEQVLFMKLQLQAGESRVA